LTVFHLKEAISLKEIKKQYRITFDLNNFSLPASGFPA